MDYEKKYKEAIERAKIWQEHLYDVNDKDYADELNYIFPELRESEDEKTKRILHSISSKMSFHLCDIFTEEEFQCFDTWSNAWLEKQGEKKESYIDMSLVDAVRFCVADNLAHKSTDDNGNTIGFGVYIDDTTAQKLTNELSDIFQKPIEWSEDDKTRLDEIVTHLKGMVSVSDIDFLKSLKDKVLPQPRQEWSEEDELTKNALINLVEMYYGGCIDKSEKNRLLNFLKSFRPQSHWRPSDEQMEVLQWCMPLWAEPKSKAILESLINDLKKLREE